MKEDLLRFQFNSKIKRIKMKNYTIKLK